ncbi:NAD-dependent epimerase/dehydratase family protein [Bradyrhizobium canariense]|uniref:Epimerase n=1 Tax=Bradyrhizobium canariense TaxID=255045 RepID=A0A1X3G070_9BRAD|nr:NAD(P)-dependent oxidoreductase [Bradyrhizobium canariense]OSI72440.1 epimerase [Bradyrhizobium canariense]OSI80882.1 epimerase [Bradyrhizobium canariense]OSI93810.1 epimerase [Bradyrhizobium canariense]OSI95041.1 epimerase [Bradyrhizobium canariense]OSJ06836.1 epimerase [Bradyrhizobium canariense]
MKILLTGASSFTGLWFARSLAASGHDVVAPLKRCMTDYAGLRGERVVELKQVADVIDDCPFGSSRFLDLAGERSWDVLCHHAAHVGDYRSPEFNVTGALAENTEKLRAVLNILVRRGLGKLVLTGSVFEQDEGAGTAPLRAFSPYGLSKGLTWQYVRFFCQSFELSLGKFVIPNPFGRFEEPRFCSFLAQSWLKGEVPAVRMPLYVRDNIPVDLLAAAYADFVETLPRQPSTTKLMPSFYVESQAAFATRFAKEMASRLGVPCPIDLLEQTAFDEPLVRINTDRLDRAALRWSETAAWDLLADYYKARHASNQL